MKLHYYPETDSLYIDLQPAVSGTDVLQIAEGIVADVDAEGRIVGLDIDQARHHLDTSKIEALGLPLVGSRQKAS